jgi:hypothetical protein
MCCVMRINVDTQSRHERKGGFFGKTERGRLLRRTDARSSLAHAAGLIRQPPLTTPRALETKNMTTP